MLISEPERIPKLELPMITVEALEFAASCLERLACP